MIENLFFCDTSYQLLSSINIALQLGAKNEECDLIIYHQFRGSREYSKRLRALNVFSQIFDIYPPSVYQKKEEILKLVFSKKYLKHSCNIKLKHYDFFYCATMDNNSAIASFIESKAKKVVLYDDGLGSYIGHIINDFMSRKRLWLLRVSHPLKPFFPVEKSMLYYPEISLSEVTKAYEKLEFKPSKEIQCVFDYIPNALYKNNVVFLDQPYLNKTEETNKRFARLTGQMQRAFGNNYTVRLHPRMKESNIESKNFDRINNLWELECVNQISDDCVIITVYSTAAIQPIMLSGARPKVVFLYHLFEGECELGQNVISQLDSFLQAIRMRIADNNFYIPSSWAALEEVLNVIGGDEHEN